MTYKVDYITHIKQLDNYCKAHRQWWGSPPMFTTLAKDHIYIGVDDNNRMSTVMFRDEKAYLMFMLKWS